MSARKLLLVVVLLAGCEQIKGTVDRAATSLSLKSSCPEPVEGRAAGAETADMAFACFQKAAKEGSADLLLRVSCSGRYPASCKQSAATKASAEQLVAELKKGEWSSSLGQWNEGKDGKTTSFAVDTKPGEKRVGVVTVCRIAEGDRWAVCEVSETSREVAEQKMK